MEIFNIYRIMPNPNSGIFSVVIEAGNEVSEYFSLQITRLIDNEIVFYKNDSFNIETLEISLPHLASGLYVATIIGQNSVGHSKLFKVFK